MAKACRIALVDGGAWLVCPASDVVEIHPSRKSKVFTEFKVHSLRIEGKCVYIISENFGEKIFASETALFCSVVAKKLAFGVT